MGRQLDSAIGKTDRAYALPYSIGVGPPPPHTTVVLPSQSTVTVAIGWMTCMQGPGCEWRKLAFGEHSEEQVAYKDIHFK